MDRRHITKIFIVEDDEVFARLMQRSLSEEENYDISIFHSGEDFLNNLYQNPDVVTIDYNLPGISGLDILKRIKSQNPDIGTIIVSGQEKAEVVVEAYSSGADHYLLKNDRTLVEIKNSVKNLSTRAGMKKEIEVLKDAIIDREKYNEIIGESQPILKVLKMIQKAEASNILVLITGESGTGKELVARALHYNSPRKRKHFVAINVPAIPDDLIESELFGHEKGAFTGAINKRIGKFEEANGGTIFLDEIGEMDLAMQTKLLRVLQEGKITRLGSNKEVDLDVRVVAATNKNLAQRVKEGKFREDLFYRLQGFLIQLPPLRDRNNDVVQLAKFFAKSFCEKSKIPLKTFSAEAVRMLLSYNWPGNIRELKSLVERAILISESVEITADDLVFSEEIV